MKKQRNYDPKIRERALKLLMEGRDVKDVAAEVGATPGAVGYWKKAWTVGKHKSNGTGSTPDRRVADAITFLKHARSELNRPANKLTRTELYALLALDSLEGGR